MARQVTVPPRQGFLYRELGLGGMAGARGGKRRLGLHSNFTQADIDAGALSFRFHYLHYSPLTDAFSFKVT